MTIERNRGKIYTIYCECNHNFNLGGVQLLKMNNNDNKDAKKIKRSIKFKLILVTSLLIILAVFLISYLTYNKSRAMLIDYTRDRLLTDGRILADMIDKYIYERSRDIMVMANNDKLKSMDVPAMEKSLLLQRFKQDFACYDSISLTNAQGLQIADSDGNTGVMKDGKEWYKAAIHGKLYISDVRLSQDLQKPVLSFASPVRDENGNIIGVITTRLRLENTLWVMVDKFEMLEKEADKTGYAYLINKQGVIMAHPDREKVLRDNIMDMGIEELKLAGEKMTRGENGFFRYKFEEVDKYAAYVPLDGWGEYKGMGWSIVFTAPVDDFLSPVYILRKYNIMLGIIVVLIGLVLSFVVAQKIVRPIQEISAVLKQVANGDLTIKHVKVKTADEVGELGASLNKMVNNLRDLIAKLKDNSVRISSHSQELSASGQQVNAAVEELASTTDEVATTTAHSAENSRSSQADSLRMQEVAKEGNQAVQQALEKINAIAENSQVTSRAVNDLGRQSGQIGKIINAITSIADQTNLLALNAAIEAARAGEHGRGFAVVAEEVRKLAEQSGEAAREITDLIKQIQKGVEEAIMNMDRGMIEVNQGVQLAKSAETALGNIIHAISHNTELIKDLVISADQVNEGTQQLSATHQQISSAVNEVSSAAQELAGIAVELQHQTENFKV